MLITISKPSSTTYEVSPILDKKPSPLLDRPFFYFLNTLVFQNFVYARKKMLKEGAIKSDINWVVKTKHTPCSKTIKIISSYWHFIMLHPNSTYIHKRVRECWKKCLLTEMQTILAVFASFQNSPKWSNIPNQIRFFTSIAHKKVRLLLRENLKLPPSIAAIDCEKTIYAYALLQANLYALYLTNVYLREGIDLCVASLTKKGYDFTASQLALYKPNVTKAESMAIRKLMSQ